MNNIIDTRLEDFKLRLAGVEDVPLILDFIKALAEYEKMSDEVLATEEMLEKSLFQEKRAEVIIGEYKEKPVAFALFFHNFSTFVGRPGLYLEDIYVNPEMRGLGIGKIFLSFLAKLAVERDCGRFEWCCLNWNEPSIKFYKSLGAKAMDEWITFRLDGEELKELGEGFKNNM